MIGPIALGAALIAVSLFYFWLSPKLKGRSLPQRYDNLPARERPFAPAPVASIELVFLLIIVIGVGLIVTAVFI